MLVHLFSFNIYAWCVKEMFAFTFGIEETMALNVCVVFAGHTGEPCWSLVAHNVDDVEKFFKETIENRSDLLAIYLNNLNSLTLCFFEAFLNS